MSGRTLWEILMGQNKPDIRPAELKVWNPLQAKIGCTVQLKNDVRFSGINFVIERITIHDTPIGEKNFRHIDYHCKGTSLETEGFVRFRLRLLPDDDATNEIGCRIQVLFLYDEMAQDDEFVKNVLGDPEGIFNINQDDAGNQLAEDQVRRYWRIEDVRDPYRSVTTVLEDEDRSGKVDSDEILSGVVIYSWDYSRLTNDENGQEFTEYLTVELEEAKRWITILRGTDTMAADVLVY